jgi:hypothetical protein
VERTEGSATTEMFLKQVKSAKARAALRRWADQESATLISAGWAGKGFTEAQVLGVYVQGYRDHLEGVILKIKEKGSRDKEYDAHKRAYRDAPAPFAEAHLAELVCPAVPLDNGGSVMLQKVVGGGFDEADEIDKALRRYTDPVGLCRQIISSLLDEWNGGSVSKPEPVGSLVDALLGTRLRPDRTIGAWAARHDGLLVDPRPWLSHGGQPLVNPFALAGRNSFSDRLPEMIVTRGKVHGDLHPGNLLVGTEGEGNSYFMVDLSRYCPSGLLCWDPVYLTLTTIAKYLPSMDFRSREALQQWVLNPRQKPDGGWPLELRAIGTGTYEAADQWARQRTSRPVWERQRLLCLVVIALILTGRDRLLTPEFRTWFFWLAARAATQLVPDTEDFVPKDPLGLPEPLIVAHVVNLDDRRDITPDAGPAAASIMDGVGDTGTAWAEFVAALRAAELDAPDAAMLAARTETLRARLAEARSAADGHGGRTARLLDDLAGTLEEALRPGVTSAEVSAACRHARLLRTWIDGPSS